MPLGDGQMVDHEETDKWRRFKVSKGMSMPRIHERDPTPRR